MKTITKKILAFLYALPLGRRRTLSLFLNDDELRLLNFSKRGYLDDLGWFLSAEMGTPTSKDGQPLPWLVYPIIEFLNDRLKDTMTVFEFGAGSSTRYFSERVAFVHSVEHDSSWLSDVERFELPNAKLYGSKVDYDGIYCRSISKPGVLFDLVLVDGRDRVNCCKMSVKFLTDVGVIILDDSERDRYGAAGNFLNELGFRRVDFWGISAANVNRRCTTIFYRSSNCLAI